MKINLSYSVKLLSEEKAQDALQYLSKHLIVDETKRKLVSIKFCELHVSTHRLVISIPNYHYQCVVIYKILFPASH